MQPTFLLLTFEIKIIMSWHLEMRILTPLLDLQYCGRITSLSSFGSGSLTLNVCATKTEEANTACTLSSALRFLETAFTLPEKTSRPE